MSECQVLQVIVTINGKYVVGCAIWYHLYNFKNVKNTPGGVLLSAGFKPATLLKLTLLHECFHVFTIVQMVPNRAMHHI